MNPCLQTFTAIAMATSGLSLPGHAQQVTPVPDALRAKFELAPFYQKHLDLDGLPILGSANVSDPALREAAWIVRRMLEEHPDIIGTLAANDVRLVVMAYNEYTTDLPEQADWQPKDYWDRRARGMGGRIGSGGEENLLCFPGDPYATENILIHEFAHTIHGFGLTRLIPDFDEQVKKAYDKAIAAGLWKGTYAAENANEYWAEGVQDWFDNNRENDSLHNQINTRAELKTYDPDLAALCGEVFGDRNWRYQKPMNRPEEQRAHLAGYDFSKAPAFKWRATSAVKPVISAVARPLPISAVRLTGGPLKNARDLDAKTLLALEPDRLLAGYRIRAGLEPKAPGYGGWDSVEGKKLTGHIAGHYLSGVSLMYAATGDERFKKRADALVQGLQEVQDQRGNGYLGAITDDKGEDGMLIFDRISKGDIRSGGFDLNGMWSPWYVLHKTFAGLRDAYRHTGNPTALEVEVKFAGWVEKHFAPLSDAQVQRILNTEFGGMNEVMVDLYTDTGDQRWLALSYKFEHHAVTDPLKHHEDRLSGLHANTQVPKLIGSLDRFVATGDPGDGFAAGYFWDTVVKHHSFATGGHGKDEYFGKPDELDHMVDGRTCETCNVYNMLKLTRELFSIRPDPEYVDFQERALFNHILSSLEPTHGWACYMVPVGRGVEREYERDMLNGGFTCCTGSSMESHALHGDGIYSESDGDKLWVNLYAPSTADWASAGVKLTTETDFPMGESATFTLTMDEPKEFTVALRRPFWVGPGFSVSVNGQPVPAAPQTGYVDIKRDWKSGDRITVTLPKKLRLEPLPDNPRRVAILWGPLVLAGDLGPSSQDGATDRGLLSVPVLVGAERPVEDWLKPVEGRQGWFRSSGVGRDRDVEFTPFYNLPNRKYAIYWDLFTPDEWTTKAAEIAAAHERQRKLERMTVAFVQPGEMQAERDANMQGDATEPDRLMDRAGRRGSKWFSFDLPVDPAHPMTLVVTYNRDEWRKRAFDILVDGEKIGTQTIDGRGGVEFFDVKYEIPSPLVQGKSKVTVKFQAVPDHEIACVYGIRMIKAQPSHW